MSMWEAVGNYPLAALGGFVIGGVVSLVILIVFAFCIPVDEHEEDE